MECGIGGKGEGRWISCVGGLGLSDWVFVTWTPPFLVERIASAETVILWRGHVSLWYFPFPFSMVCFFFFLFVDF